MPKLSDLIRESGAPTTGKMKLSQVVGQAPDFSASQYPNIGNATGFTPEFSKATGMSGFLESLPGVLADTFGNYEDVKNAVAPYGKVIRDKDGVEVLELPSGERFAMNQKGLDTREVLSGVARTGAAVAAGRAVPAGAPLLMRALGSGGAAAASDMAMQKLAGRDSIDRAQTAISGAFGAGGELLAPVLGAAAGKVKQLFRGDAGALEAGKTVAKDMGIEVSDDIARQLGSRIDEIQAGASPNAILAEIELGTQLTKGQRLRPDAQGAFSQLSREEMLANNQNSIGGGVLRDMRQRQGQALTQALGRAEEAIGGANRPANPSAAAELIQSAVSGSRNAAKAETDALYGALRNADATFSAEGVKQVPGLARAAVADFDVEALPATSRALAMLDEAMTGAQSIQRVGQIMTRLTNSVGAAANKADRAAMLRVKAAMQTWMDDATQNAVISGDDAAIRLLKNARESRATLARLFENKETAGTIVPQLVKGAKSADELAQLMFGASTVSPAATATVSKQVKAAIGDNPEAWNAFRSAVLMRATRNQAGEALGPQALASNLTKLLNTRPELMKSLFNGEEISMLGRVANAAREISPKSLAAYGAGNMAGVTSGTAERALRFISDIATRSPIVGKLLGMASEVNTVAAARAPVSAAAPRIGAGFGAAAQPALDQNARRNRR